MLLADTYIDLMYYQSQRVTSEEKAMGRKSVVQSYRELSAKAAEFEREGHMVKAHDCWVKAGSYATTKRQSEWCAARVSVCARYL